MQLHICCTGLHVRTLPDLRAVSRTLWPSQHAHAGKCLRGSSHTAHSTHRHQEQQHRQCRAQVVTKAGVVAASSQTLALQALPQLEPQLAFVAHTLCRGVLLPILGGWLFASALSAVASRARQWCDEHPDEPLSMELLGLLPAALESPTRVAVALFVTTRVLRNTATGLHEYVQAFKPQWDDWADAAAHSVVHWLGPFDQTLLRLYTVVAVVAGARVLIKWKTIALEFILHQRAGLAQANLVKQGSHLRQKRKGAAVSSGSSFTSSGGPTAAGSSMAAGAAAAAAAAAPASSTIDIDDFDEAAVMQREGSMLSVSMRPRSIPASVMPDVEPVPAAAASSRGGLPAAAKASDWGSRAAGSGSGQGGVPAWSEPGTRQDDAVERLLLPLDSILSWAIAVMAGLFAVQTLGINIQPLLAVGGASSLIIGLATQTLLTNAVMGVSIFLSRPFVPGDSITVQAAGAILVSGVVEKVTPMRTLLRTDDDVLVTLPNKTIADMIVYNKSRREARNRLVARSWERPFLKFKVKLPQKELQHLQELQVDLLKVLKRPGVAQRSIDVALSKFTDARAEVLLQCLLLVAVGSPTAQQLLLDLAFTVRKHGASLVSIL